MGDPAGAGVGRFDRPQQAGGGRLRPARHGQPVPLQEDVAAIVDQPSGCDQAPRPRPPRPTSPGHRRPDGRRRPVPDSPARRSPPGRREPSPTPPHTGRRARNPSCRPPGRASRTRAGGSPLPRSIKSHTSSGVTPGRQSPTNRVTWSSVAAAIVGARARRHALRRRAPRRGVASASRRATRAWAAKSATVTGDRSPLVRAVGHHLALHAAGQERRLAHRFDRELSFRISNIARVSWKR